MRLLSTLLLLCVILTSCGIRQNELSNAHTAYNESFNTGHKREVLLNLVRVRYRDSIAFLQAHSLTSQFEYSTFDPLELDFSFTKQAMLLNGGSAKFQMPYKEKPTITYSPLTGENYSMQILTPIEIKTFTTLFFNGWSASRIFSTCLQSINGEYNFPEHPPGVKQSKFHEIVSLVSDLQSRHHLKIGLNKVGHEFEFFFHLPSEFSESEDSTQLSKKLKQLLQLNPKIEHYTIKHYHFGAYEPDENSIHINLRSLVKTIFYLSFCVEVPKVHLENGYVPLISENMRAYWDKQRDAFLNIQSSKSEPMDAFVKVKYLDYWFYVSNRDVSSKVTFAFLSQLQALKVSSPDLIPAVSLSI